MYDDFAAVYDSLMDDFDYPAWARYYLSIIRAAGCAPRTMCECGCGTGSLAVYFARAGVRLTASDLSEEMLRLAQIKSRKAGVSIPFVCQDMRALELPRPVDAIAACCDAVNYLTDRDSVRAFFDGAFRFLKKGGVLAFDISSRDKLTRMDGAFYGEERDSVAYLWQNRMDPETRVLAMDLTFFVETEGGLYRRFEEHQLQRAHDVSELTAWLGESGFTDIRVYGDRTMSPPAEGEARIHFTAKKS